MSQARQGLAGKAEPGGRRSGCAPPPHQLVSCLLSPPRREHLGSTQRFGRLQRFGINTQCSCLFNDF
jgi:hypothetical protein